MKQKSGPGKAPAEQVLKDIRRQTRRQYSAEEKIRIVLEGLRGEENISELCRREGIAASMYYGWSKEFLEAGKRRLAGDTARNLRRGQESPSGGHRIVTRRLRAMGIRDKPTAPSLAMAEWLCRTVDRIHPPRVLGSYRRFR